MTTVQNLIDTTKNRYLLAGLREQQNRLSAPYTAGGTTLAFQYELRGIAAGVRLSVGLATFYVWSVDTASQTAIVTGGDGGTTDIDVASGAVVTVAPRFTDSEIFAALNEDVLSLSSPVNGLYQVQRVTFPFNSSTVGYDLAGVTDARQVLEVRYDQNDPSRTTPRLHTGDYRLERLNSTSDYTSGYSLKLFRGGAQGRNINVLLKSGFTTWTSPTNDALSSGLAVSQLDLPPMGAALRLLAGKEVRRNQTEAQGDTRRASEVGPGAVAASSRDIRALRAQRISEEATALQALYPARIM